MASFLTTDARSSVELQTVIRGMAAAPNELTKQIRRANNDVLRPAVSRSMAEHVNTPFESGLILASHTVAVSDRNIKITAGAKNGRSFSNGLSAKDSVKVAEFGANREKYTGYVRENKSGGKYSRKTKGSAYYHKVVRRVHRPWRAPRRGGYVFFPTVADMAPRILAMWVQTSVRMLHEISEGKVR